MNWQLFINNRRDELPRPRGYQRAVYVFLGLLVSYSVVRGVASAAAKPFWYDELMTLTVSSQGNWKGIVQALRPPLDSNPPLFYVIENLALKSTRSKEIALRLPSILAFPCTLACVFLYLRKRAGEVAALLCASLLLLTSLFHVYAVEARPYSLVVACFAFAMVCYQRASLAYWTLLLAVTFALAQSLHYYAILAMVPFGIAEAIHLFRRRQVRWSVWAALVFGALPLAVFWPLLAEIKAYYGAHMWARVNSVSPLHVYGEILGTGWRTGEGIAAIIFAGLLGELFRVLKETDMDKKNKDEGLAQIALLFGFLFLPFIGFAATTMNSGLIPRYVLCTVLGISAGIGFVFHRVRPMGVFLFGVFVFAIVVPNEIHFWRLFRTGVANVNSFGATSEKLIEEGGHSELAVAVPDGLVAVPLAHYTSPSLAKRLVFLTQDPELNNKRFSDTIDRELQLFQSYSALKVSTFDEFTAANSQFLFYVDEQSHAGDWFARRLSRESWLMETLLFDGSHRLYLVKRSRNSGAPGPKPVP